jgi:ferritin
MAIKGLIKDELNESLNELVGECFLGNRILDRMMSILNIKFVMNNTSKILHGGMAHKFPLLADMISYYQGSRNNLTIYPETPRAEEDYSSPFDLFTRFYNYMIELEDSVKEVIEQAIDIKDKNTKVFLDNFLLNLNKYTEQAILLVDKSEAYKDNWMDFDRDIDKFFILGDEI